MQVTITGNTVQTVAALVAVLGAMFELNRRVIKGIVESILNEYIQKMDEKFMLAAGSELTGYQIEDRFKRSDARIKGLEYRTEEIDKRTRRRYHTLKNKLTPVYLKLDLDPIHLNDPDED